MESKLVSWQVENFSSAELVSPPVSPPPSPSNSLYNYNSNGEQKASPSSSATARGRIASSFLNDIEEIRKSMDDNDFGTNWNEESVNLSLFEELEEIEYTPPASPAKGSGSPQPSQKESLALVNITDPFLNNGITINNAPQQSQPQASPSSEFNNLLAQFQAVLDSLPQSSEVENEALTQVLEIAGIPTTIINGEALVPIEVDLSTLSSQDYQAFDLDIVDVEAMEESNNISEDEDDNDSIDESSQMYDLSDTEMTPSANNVMLSDANELGHDHYDRRSQAAGLILDALLLGDVETAEQYLPEIDEESNHSNDSSFSITSEESVELEEYVPPKKSAKKQQENRGRKPAKKNPKKSPIKDRSIRKKEQNKTAATKYRQKKKMEFSLILDTEAELQEQHNTLEKKKSDLAKEIEMVKQLLRDVIKAKKPQHQQTPKGNVPIAVVSVSGRNRRK